MTLKKMSAALAVLLASTALTACGGDNNGTTSDCADGEQKVKLSADAEAQCAKACTSVAECGSDERCVGGFCIAATMMEEDMDVTPVEDMDVMPTPDMDTPTPDMDTPTPDMDTPTPDMDTPTPDMDTPDMSGDVDALCVSYCDKLFGNCATATCTNAPPELSTEFGNAYEQCVNGGMDAMGQPIAPCRDQYVSDPDYKAAVDQAETVACEDIKDAWFCGQLSLGDACDCPPVNGIGDACMADDECQVQCLTEAQGLPGGYCIAAGCQTDADCQDSQCVGGGIFTDANDNPLNVCMPGCQTDADCRDGYVCADIDENGASECFVEITTADGDGVPGGECMSTSDCAGGSNGFCATEADSGFPGGYCIVSGCDADPALCVAGSHCTTLQNGGMPLPVCLDTCADSSECRAGYECSDLDGNMVNECWPVPPSADGNGIPGEACSSISDCTGGANGGCIPEDGDMDGTVDFPGGYCVIDCLSDANLCVAGSECTVLETDPNTMAPTNALCLGSCSMAEPCRTGYICVDFAAQMPVSGNGTGVCLPQ